jgi:hypothetical protein
VREIRIAAEQDPLSQAAVGTKLNIEFWAGIKEPLGNPGSVKGMIDPTHPGTRVGIGLALAKRKRCPEAYKAIRGAQELAPDNTLVVIGLDAVHFLCGNVTAAQKLLSEISRRPDAPVFAVYIAPLYAFEYQTDSAFAVLDRARWNMGSYFELRTNRNLDPLRKDPRFAQLLQRLRIPT